MSGDNPDGSLHRTFEYNSANRLAAVRDGAGALIAEYRYDPFGRRIQSQVYDPPGNTTPEVTWYVYTDQGLMAELDDQGNQKHFYLFPPDGLWSTDPILRRDGTTTFYYQTDHLGTPQQLIDPTGALVHSREMRAFGETVEQGMGDGWRFPGQLHSVETGFYYNYFRDYAPHKGRYVQSDPIGLEGGVNMYAYSDGNPIDTFDPYGLVAWSGTYFHAGGSFSRFGYGYFIFSLWSECVDGNRIFARVKATGGSASFASTSVGFHGSWVKLEDGRSKLDVNALAGDFGVFSTGGSFGIGYGCAAIFLGDAISTESCGLQGGLGGGLYSGFAGRSRVLSQVEVSCECE